MEKDSQPSIIQEVIIYSLARKCPPSYQHFWSHHHLSADTEANLTWNDVSTGVSVTHSSVEGVPNFLMAGMFGDNGELTVIYI